jgi:tripartite-type tricarboxylate transporter receptor subunit TctC
MGKRPGAAFRSRTVQAQEAGVDGVDVTQWYAMFAPAKTPKPIVDQITKALNQVLADKDVIKRMEDNGADVESSSPEQLGALAQLCHLALRGPMESGT